MKPIDKIYSFLTTIIIISLCFSLALGWIPILNRIWIFVFILSFTSIAIYTGGLKHKFIITLMFYGIVLYINVISGDMKFDFIFSTMELFCLILISYVFYIYSKDTFYNARHYFMIYYIIVILITFFGTLFVYLKEPEVLRMIQAERNMGVVTLYTYYSRFGVESYGTGHALPCLIPILVYLIKNKRIKNRLFYSFMLIIIILLIYMSTATTALLLSIFLLIVSFIWNGKNNVVNIINLILCSCIAIFVISNRDILGNILGSIDLESGTTYAGKLNDFQEYTTYGKVGSKTSNRIDLYKQSLDVFLQFPIFGSDGNEIGGHSVFFDRLALLGLLGFIPLILYLYSYMRYVLKQLSRNIKPYCFMGFLYFIILGCLKNIFVFEYIAITLLIMPLACVYIDRKSKY